MQSPAFDLAVRRLRSLTTDDSSDSDLLRRFVAQRDQGAFAELMARHGPSVLGICRRILAHSHDAEDAFQTTFLTLARQARSIRQPGSLGCWLHGVALRVAIKTRNLNRSEPLTDVPAVERDEVSWKEVRRVLDEELGRLPERWRFPVVLCYVEGKTRDEAAQTLGWKLSTLRGRLEDGRLRLRERLSRRGVELSAAMLALAAVRESAAIPLSLREATLLAVQTMSKGFVMSKLAIGAIVLVLGLGTTLFNFRGEASDPPKAKTPEPPAKQAIAPELLAMFNAADRVWLVNEPNGVRNYERPNETPQPIEVLKGMTPPAEGFSFKFDVEALTKLPRKGHQYIVFLNSIDEVDHIPKLVPIAGEKWYLPREEATLTALRNYVPPCEWGEPAFGLRLGVHPRPGDEATVEVVMQNIGKEESKILQWRGNYVDDWPQLSFDVTAPDGKNYRLERIGKPPKDGDAPVERILKPGERYIHVVRLNRWLTPPVDGRMGNAPAGLFAAAGDYSVQARCALSDVRSGERGLIALIRSRPAKITIAEGGLFGESVGDVRIRLQQPKGPFAIGDYPKLVCDLENRGDTKRSIFTMPENASIELDGVWHHSHREGSFGGQTHIQARGTLSNWLTVTPSAQWMYLVDHHDGFGPITKVAVPFRLLAGKHSLRVAYTIDKDLRVISNAITIEVAADGWGEEVGGYRTRLRLGKPKYSVGEPFTFELDVKSVNAPGHTFHPLPYDAIIELDAQRFIFNGAIDHKASPKEVKAGGECKSFITVTTDQDWKMPFDDGLMPAPRFTLKPGKHKVRVLFPLTDKISPASNVVEFEIDALTPEVKDLVRKADRIWVVNAPTPAVPVPERIEVLKGPAGPGKSLFDLRKLPGEDAKAKFIVFLTTEEDGIGTAKVQAMAVASWHLTYTPELASAIRLHSEQCAWGDENINLRLGLRLDPTFVKGQPIVAEIVLRNNGPKPIDVKQHRLNIYDYWPNTKFEVALGQTKWLLAKPQNEMNEADALLPMTLAPGESYVHAVRLTAWPDVSHREETPLKVFSMPGEYSITVKYTGAAEALSSASVKVTISK